MKGVNDLLSTYGLVHEVSKITYAAFERGKQYRARKFFEIVELRYDSMTLAEKEKFKKIIESETGQKIVSDYAIAVASTPSMVVNASLALLYAQDPDFDFAAHEVERFVAAVIGLTDRKIDFLLKIQKLTPVGKKSLFPEYYIKKENFGILKNIVDIDEVFIYVSDFQSRGLLLTETNREEAFGFGDRSESEDIKWSVAFSLSNTQMRYVALFRKAKELLSELKF